MLYICIKRLNIYRLIKLYIKDYIYNFYNKGVDI